MKGYLQIQLPKPHNYYAHQVAWLWVYGEWPTSQIDHINRVRSDNRIANLRMANDSENGCNKGMQRNNQSGFTGVWFANWRGKWEASISKDGQRVA